eukprot:946672-Prymnesium_polylepis.1
MRVCVTYGSTGRRTRTGVRARVRGRANDAHSDYLRTHSHAMPTGSPFHFVDGARADAASDCA